MSRQQPRNIYGQRMTLFGAPDKRVNNGKKFENEGQPYVVYDVLERPDDARRWYIVGTVVLTAERSLISRHVNRAKAEKIAEGLRQKQPGRKPQKLSVKAQYKKDHFRND